MARVIYRLQDCRGRWTAVLLFSYSLGRRLRLCEDVRNCWAPNVLINGSCGRNKELEFSAIHCALEITLAILRELLINLFHAFHVVAAGDYVVDHCERIIFSNNALGSSLNRFGGDPRFVNVFCWKVLQRRNVFSDVITVRVSLSAELHWAVAVEELLEEGRAAQPKPHSGIHTPVGIEEKFFEHFHAFLPAYPQVATS